MQTKYWVYILSFLRLDSNKIYLSKGTLAYKGVDFVAIEPLFARINNVIVICVIVSIVVHVDLALLVTALVSLTLGHFPLLLCIVHLKQGQILSYSTTNKQNLTTLYIQGHVIVNSLCSISNVYEEGKIKFNNAKLIKWYKRSPFYLIEFNLQIFYQANVEGILWLFLN